jgi:hypothetical protein
MPRASFSHKRFERLELFERFELFKPFEPFDASSRFTGALL